MDKSAPHSECGNCGATLRLLTFTKLCAVGFTHLIGIALTLAVTALLSMLIA